jgi:hypothetical protein
LLARSRRIDLVGKQIETPLLVPSISSKAVGPIEVRNVRGKPHLVAASTVHTDTLVRAIDEAVLISGYDVHFGFLSDVKAFRNGFADSVYAIPGTLFIDSGWYEKSVGPAAGQWYYEVGPAEQFGQSDYVDLVDSLDSELKAVLVSWDGREGSRDGNGTYAQQIESAQALFSRWERFSSDILLKPERHRLNHDFDDLPAGTAARLRAFNIVGVTEKELGEKILDRVKAIARFRRILDEVGVAAPIHVFGGLDPLSTPLYFAAGAEIFDGLTWLRYAFRDGMSIHIESAPFLDREFEKKLSVAVAHVQLRNLDALRELGRELKVFLHNGCDWGKLRRGEALKPAFEALESALGIDSGR